MKRDLNWYMNTAKELNNIKSDRKLAIELGLANIAPWRNPDRHNVPSVSSMIKLAQLAKVPVETALIERDIWEAEFTTPEAVPYLKKMLKTLQNIAAILLLAMLITLGSSDFDGDAMASTGSAPVPDQYILWKIFRCKKAPLLKLWQSLILFLDFRHTLCPS